MAHNRDKDDTSKQQTQQFHALPLNTKIFHTTTGIPRRSVTPTVTTKPFHFESSRIVQKEKEKQEEMEELAQEEERRTHKFIARPMPKYSKPVCKSFSTSTLRSLHSIDRSFNRIDRSKNRLCVCPSFYRERRSDWNTRYANSVHSIYLS